METESKRNLRKTRALLRLKMLGGFKPIPVIKVPVIPREKTKFPGTPNDYWEGVQETGNVNRSRCIYTLDGNAVFCPHIHENHDEILTVRTKGAKIEWVTEEGIYYYVYGDTFKVAKGVMHALVNLVDFPVEFLIEWRPKMQGWEGQFV